MPATAARPASGELVDLGMALGMVGRAGVVARRLAIGPGTGGTARLAGIGAHPALVIEGAILRTTRIGQRASALLHGPGDVLAGSGSEPAPFEARARALTPSIVVVLDPPMLGSIAGAPALATRVSRAVEAQADMLGLQALLGQLTSIAERLDIILPLLAERWGTVSAHGVMLPAFLTHTVLAELIGVRRPSLTTALAELVARGTMRRLDDRRWLLSPEVAGLAA